MIKKKLIVVVGIDFQKSFGKSWAGSLLECNLYKILYFKLDFKHAHNFFNSDPLLAQNIELLY